MARHLERTNTTPTPPPPWDSDKKMQKCRRRRQKALWCFLAMSAMIGRKYAPDFDGVHPQGVHSDSLESFKSMGGCKWEASRRVQRRRLYYMYCRDVIYIIYIGFYNTCGKQVRTAVG